VHAQWHCQQQHACYSYALINRPVATLPHTLTAQSASRACCRALQLACRDNNKDTIHALASMPSAPRLMEADTTPSATSMSARPCLYAFEYANCFCRKLACRSRFILWLSDVSMLCFCASTALNACSPPSSYCVPLQMRRPVRRQRRGHFLNACAVSDKKCVPQRADEGLYPIPRYCALDTAFDLNNFQGRWFITAGQNPLFDIFDCQVRCEVDHSPAAG